MKYLIMAMYNGHEVFSAESPFVPRQHEQLKVGRNLFVVRHVRYHIEKGTALSAIHVTLYLEKVA